MRISPMVQVSMSMPASVTMRQISLLSNALPAKLTWVTVLLNASAAACTNFVARATHFIGVDDVERRAELVEQACGGTAMEGDLAFVVHGRAAGQIGPDMVCVMVTSCRGR